MIDKGICDKGFIWNPSNCECECDKSCDVGEYLDYENCKCRKKLVDKLLEEFNEEIDGNEMIYSDYANVCNSCTIYIVSFVIVFLIITGISSAFIYFHWYLKRNNKNIDIYYIEYITIKDIGDYESIPLSFIIGKIDGYIEESNGNKYLIFASTDINKEVLTKYTEL